MEPYIGDNSLVSIDKLDCELFDSRFLWVFKVLPANYLSLNRQHQQEIWDISETLYTYKDILITPNELLVIKSGVFVLHKLAINKDFVLRTVSMTQTGHQTLAEVLIRVRRANNEEIAWYLEAQAKGRLPRQLSYWRPINPEKLK